MALYVVQSKKPGHLSLRFNTDSPKDAFIQFLNYTEKDKCNGIVIEECDVSKSQFDIYLQGAGTYGTGAYGYVTSYRLSRPSLNIESLILRHRLANTLIPARNLGCFFIPLDAGTCIYYIPDNCNNLLFSIADDLNNSQLLMSTKTLKVVGGRALQLCNSLFSLLVLDCLDLTDFYAPLSTSWKRAFQNSFIDTIVGLQNQSFVRVKDVEFAFDHCRINTLDFHGMDFSCLFDCENCFYFSQIDTIDLTDIKLSDIYRLANMFYGATIKNGLDLSKLVLNNNKTHRMYNAMFYEFTSSSLNIRNWTKHRDSIYDKMFVGTKVGKLYTNLNSPFKKQYKKESKEAF